MCKLVGVFCYNSMLTCDVSLHFCRHRAHAENARNWRTFRRWVAYSPEETQFRVWESYTNDVVDASEYGPPHCEANLNLKSLPVQVTYIVAIGDIQQCVFWKAFPVHRKRIWSVSCFYFYVIGFWYICSKKSFRFFSTRWIVLICGGSQHRYYSYLQVSYSQVRLFAVDESLDFCCKLRSTPHCFVSAVHTCMRGFVFIFSDMYTLL